jgi:hypothetical protein
VTIRTILYSLLILIAVVPSNATIRLRAHWERSGARVRGTNFSSVLRRDAARDATTRSVRLTNSRAVARYTSQTRARLERRTGISSGSHFTSRLHRGRPMSSKNARLRLGLPKRPSVRESVVLRKGTQVRFNKALHGRPGIGEITIVRRVPRENIQRIVRLRR